MHTQDAPSDASTPSGADSAVGAGEAEHLAGSSGGATDQDYDGFVAHAMADADDGGSGRSQVGTETGYAVTLLAATTWIVTNCTAL